MLSPSSNQTIHSQFAGLLREFDRYLRKQKTEHWDGVPIDPQMGVFVLPPEKKKSYSSQQTNPPFADYSFQILQDDTSPDNRHSQGQKTGVNQTSSDLRQFHSTDEPIFTLQTQEEIAPTSSLGRQDQKKQIKDLSFNNVEDQPISKPLRIGWRKIDGHLSISSEQLHQAQNELTNLQRQAFACHACRLAKGRQSVVFGQGKARTKLLLVGASPGILEDHEGLPFVGELGKLLDGMLWSMGLRRDEVYLTNIVKCHVPNGRNPESEEVASCFNFLREQIKITQPEVILTLGSAAVHALLGARKRLRDLRGQWSDFEGIPLLPTFCLKYLLKYPQDKKRAWQDLQMIIDRLQHRE